MINLSQIQLKSEDNNMDSQFLSNYQQIFKQQQKSFTMQEGVEIQLQLSERQVDRSRQRQLFEQQNNKLQNSHHGDSEIQEQSIYDGTDNTFFELKQQRSIAEGLMLKANVSSELNQYPNNNQNMNEIIFRAQNNNVDDSQQKLKQNQNDFDNTVIFDKEILQQLTSNDHPSDIKSINVQDQTNIFLSQNLSNNAEKMSQVAKNSFQSCGKRKNIFNNEVWLQDDIFFEKNFQKQETKIASVFKKQYQINQNSNRSPSNYKQNFLIATNIINRVLNTSLCRVAKIRQHVQNFITILKLRHFNKRIDDLNINDYLSINDLSHFQILKNKKTQNSKISFLIKFFEKISKVIPIFMPTDSARIIWDMIQVMFTYSFLYIYSLFIFFDQLDINTQFINRLILYSFIIFLVDIIISLNTAIFNKDSIIVRRRLISKQYFLSTTFVTDFLSMFVLSLKLFSSNQFTVTHENDNLFKYGLNSLIFLKLNGISQKKKRFDYIFTLTENQKHIIKLIKQIASVMTAAHIAAIGWYFLGVQEIKSNQSSWLDKIGIQNNLYYEKYAYSIYWSITTMTTGISLGKVWMYSLKVENQFQKNNIICNILKLSLKQQNDQRYLLFNTQNEIFTSEEYSISQSLTEEEDEGESSLQMQSNFEDQTINSSQKIFQKAFTRKKTEQFQKNQKKTSNIYSQNTEENQFNISQEKISENNQSNQENYEQNKITSNIQPSDVKISSLEVLDNFNSNNPNLHFRQKLLFSQQCKTIQKKEQDNQCQSDREIKNYQSDDKKESVIASFKKLDQLNTEIYNQMNQEQQNYIKFLQEQILLQNKIFNCLIFKNELPLIQQLMFQSNKQDSKDTFQKQNTQDIRKNSVKNDNQVKKNSFIQLIRDLKEKRLSNSGQNLNQLNYQNIQDKQNNFILNQMQQQKQQYQQQQLQDKACNLNQNTQYTDKIYSNLQDSSIPFILQFSNCKTFFNTDSDNSSIIINQFDKIDHFKRYFPHNNFLRVNQRLKQYQIEQKKLKKNNQCLKQRRLGLSSNMTTSVFQGNFNIIRFFPQDYNINLYKPTYLSYGVKMQQGNIFPKNFKLQKN
ncbi:hypothetical protein ABPG74_004825 [Tetrahymena malaccensis]